MKISAWKTEDGRVFEDRGKAIEHDAWLELVGICRGACMDVGMNPVVSDSEAIASYLLEHAVDMRRVLRKAKQHE
ncbi:MAG: hypothetical protein V3W41_22240 [Planctomycetota bacterium]